MFKHKIIMGVALMLFIFVGVDVNHAQALDYYFDFSNTRMKANINGRILTNINSQIDYKIYPSQFSIVKEYSVIYDMIAKVELTAVGEDFYIKNVKATSLIYGSDQAGEIANASWRIVVPQFWGGAFYKDSLSKYYYHNKITDSFFNYNPSLPNYSNPIIPKGTTAILYFKVNAYDRARPDNLVAFYFSGIEAVGLSTSKNLSINTSQNNGLLGYRMITK